MKKGKNTESLKIFSEVFESKNAPETERAVALYYVAYLNSAAGNNDAALKAYNKLQTMKGASKRNRHKALIQMSDIYLKKGEKEKAVKILEQIIADAAFTEKYKISASNKLKKIQLQKLLPKKKNSDPNAVFNGDFQYGFNYWVLMPPATEGILTAKKSRGGKKITLVINAPDNNPVLMIANQYFPVKVKPGEKYCLELIAAPADAVQIGIAEGKQLRGTSTPKYPSLKWIPVKNGSAEYKVPEGVSEIRAAIKFTPGKNHKQAKICLVAIRVPEKELPATSSQWPPKAFASQQFIVKYPGRANFLKKHADSLKENKGLTTKEYKEMREAAKTPEIVAPYKAIEKLPDNTFKTLTSEFVYEGSPLPQIKIKGNECLARPMQLELFGSHLKTAGDLKIKASDSEVVASQKFKFKDINIDLSSKLLTDSLLIVDLTLNSTKPEKINDLILRIPLKKDIGRYIRFCEHTSRLKGFRKFGHGPIPQPGEKVTVKYNMLNGLIVNKWNPKITNASEAVLWEWNSGFLPYFWLGNEDIGLGWIAESAKGWSNSWQDSTLKIIRKPDALEAELVFISKPVILKGERKIQFILQATPPKPVKPYWFKNKLVNFWNARGGKSGKRSKMLIKSYKEQVKAGKKPVKPEWKPYFRYPRLSTDENSISYVSWPCWSTGCGSVTAKNDFLKDVSEIAKVWFNSQVMPYLALTHLSGDNPVAQYYGVKTTAWTMLPFRAPGSLIKMCPGCTDYADYMAWKIGKLIDENDLSALYFDNCHLSECENEQHGCGWRDDNGKLHPTIPFLKAREFFKKIRYQLTKRGKEPYIVTHVGLRPAEVSFVDAVIYGEGCYGLDYTELCTPGEFRARNLGCNQFGVIRVYLSNMGTGLKKFRYPGSGPDWYNRPANTRNMLANWLPHGTQCMVSSLNNYNEGSLYPVWEIFQQLEENTVDFIGYWKWDINKTLPADIYVSMYKQQKRALVVVSNLGDKEVEVSLSLPKIKKLFSYKKLNDPEGGKIIEDTKALLLKVKSKDFRLIMLEK